jgi:nitroreductase
MRAGKRRTMTDAYLTLISVRAIREFTDRPISDKAVERILQAGRVSGSSQNRQPWTFYVARSAEMQNRIAPTVWAPENLEQCRLAVAIASAKGGFDIGRCAERMMIGAWADGIASVPNGVKDQDALKAILELPEDQSVTTIVSFGYPSRAKKERSVEALLARANRKPLAEIAHFLD